MKPTLRQAYLDELARAREAEHAADLDRSLRHLARAHILSQRFAFAHAATHLRMLRLGLIRRRPREVLGQATRTLAALLFSRIWVPIGNTGLADVSAFRPMPVPEDLARLLD